MSNPLAKGEVRFTVEGTEYVLRPTMAAFSQINHRYDDYADLIRRITRNDVGAIAFVLRQGLGYGDKEARTLPALIMKAGVSALIEPTTDFVFRMFNAGKSPDEVMKEETAKLAAEAEGTEGAGKEAADPLLGA